MSAKEAIKLFAHKQRMRLSSAQADIEIQALKKSLNLLSRLDISMTAERITLSAKEEIVINGGGSYTIWNASGITSGTTGVHTVQAASYQYPPGKRMPVVMPDMPEVQPEQRFHLQFKVVNELSGRAMAHMPYRMALDDGTSIYGTTDAQGLTQPVTSGQPKEVSLEWLPTHTLPAEPKDQTEKEC